MKLIRTVKKYNPWLLLRMLVKSLNRDRVLRQIPTLEPLEGANPVKYIVSLTSYGKRLADTAPYAIVTLLNQSVRPDKIVLWAANEDKENIPPIMEELVKKGLEIRFCEDIKSYTKLIPSLEEFPEDCVITADDDIFYPPKWLEQMISEHEKNPKKIICHRAHGIKTDENNNPLPYDEWDDCRPGLKNIFPTGVGGILYPPKCFHEDILNRDLFMKLAPRADDIWFWAMAAINKKSWGKESPYIVIENSCNKNLWYVDFMGQLNGSALWNYNCAQNGNDRQLKAVIEQYPQIKETLAQIRAA